MIYMIYDVYDIYDIYDKYMIIIYIYIYIIHLGGNSEFFFLGGVARSAITTKIKCSLKKWGTVYYTSFGELMLWLHWGRFMDAK